MNILAVLLCFTAWRIDVNMSVKYFFPSLLVGFLANLLLDMKEGLEI